MKQKMFTPLLVVVLLFSSFISEAATANYPTTKELKAKVITMTEEQKRARLETIKMRLLEIKDMDKSTLTKEQRKDLRAELRNMNKEAKVASGGVYLSVGAIIIVILLLILIL
ncbi:MAG: hypothetical protein H7101_13240 [Deinococcales bacterium]|nr:hypothetical protein [Chitinophagaceae bacterium]